MERTARMKVGVCVCVCVCVCACVILAGPSQTAALSGLSDSSREAVPFSNTRELSLSLSLSLSDLRWPHLVRFKVSIINVLVDLATHVVTGSHKGVFSHSKYQEFDLKWSKAELIIEWQRKRKKRILWRE